MIIGEKIQRISFPLNLLLPHSSRSSRSTAFGRFSSTRQAGSSGLSWNTVDGRNPANQLRLVVYPISYRVLFIHPRWLAGFLPSTARPNTKSCIFWGGGRLREMGLDLWPFQPFVLFSDSTMKLKRLTILDPATSKGNPAKTNRPNCAHEICVPAAGMPPAEHENAKTPSTETGKNENAKTAKTRKRRKRNPFRSTLNTNVITALGMCQVYECQQSIPYTLNMNVLTALGMCKVCTETVNSVARKTPGPNMWKHENAHTGGINLWTRKRENLKTAKPAKTARTAKTRKRENSENGENA